MDLSILIKTILQSPNEADINRIKTELQSKLGNININTNNKGLKLLDTNEIDLYQRKMKNMLASLSIGKEEILATPAIKKDMDVFLNDLTKVGSVGSKSTKELGVQFSELSTKVRKSAYDMSMLRKDTDSFTTTFVKDLGKLSIWAMAATAVYAPLRAFRTGISYITDIDTALTNLNKVTNESTESLKKFALEANKIGNSLARTSDEVINSTTEFARLGYNLQQSTILAKQAMLYSNVGDLDEITASTNLISAIKGFGIEVDLLGNNVQNIVNIYNEVGNNFAISSAGIGEAMSKSAASLYGAGNTMEEAVAMITAANAVVQNPNSVGTALKTVSMRLRGIADEGEELEEDLVPKLRESFNKLGLEILDDNDTFKSTYEIMNDLAGTWENLTDVQKANITELVAGKRQGNIVVSMLNNWKDAEDALITSLMSENSAIKENEKYMESIEAKKKQLVNTIQGVWQKGLDSNTIKNFVDALTTLVRVFGNLPSIITLATTALLVWKGTAISSAIVGAYEFVASLFAIVTGEFAVVNSTIVLTGAFNTLKFALLKNPIGIVALAFASLAATILLTKDNSEQLTKSTSEQLNGQMQVISSNNKRIQTLELLGAKQSRLNDEIKNGSLSIEELADKQKQLKDVTDKINLVITDEIRQKMELNGVRDDEIAKIIELINGRNDELKNQYTTQLAMTQNAVAGARDRINAYQEELNVLKALQSAQANSLREKYGATGDIQSRKPEELKDAGIFDAFGFFVSDLVPKSSSFEKDIVDYNATYDKINDIEKKIQEKEALIIDSEKILNESLDNLKNLEDNLSGSPDPLTGGGPSSSSTESYTTDQYTQSLASLNAQLSLLEYNKSLLSSTSQSYRDILTEEIQIQKQIQDLTHAEADRLRAKLASGGLDQKEIDDTNKTIQDLGNTWVDLQKKINDNNFEVATSQIGQFDKKVSDLGYELESLKIDEKGLISGTSAYNNNQKAQINITDQMIRAKEEEIATYESLIQSESLSAKQKEELITTCKKLKNELKELQVTNNDYADSIYKSIIAETKTTEQAKLDEIERQIKSQIEIHKQNIDSYQNEIDALEDKADLEDEILERQKRQLELQKLQLKLQKVLNDKNVQILKKQEDGTWQFAYVADPDKIEDLNDEIKSKQESFTKWELDNIRNAEKKQLQALINGENDKINALEKSLDNQKEAFNTFFDTLESISAEGLDSLNLTLGSKWDNILNTIKEKVALAVIEQKKLLKGTSSISVDSGGWVTTTPEEFGLDNTHVNSDTGLTDYVEAVRDALIDNGGVAGSSDIASSMAASGLIYADGGETQSTGLHWLDGTKGKPERVLSSEQTTGFNKLIQNIPDLLNGIDITKNLISRINLPNLSGISNNNSTSSNSQVFHVTANFPNVNSSIEIEKALKNLSDYTLQVARS